METPETPETTTEVPAPDEETAPDTEQAPETETEEAGSADADENTENTEGE